MVAAVLAVFKFIDVAHTLHRTVSLYDSARWHLERDRDDRFDASAPPAYLSDVEFCLRGGWSGPRMTAFRRGSSQREIGGVAAAAAAAAAAQAAQAAQDAQAAQAAQAAAQAAASTLAAPLTTTAISVLHEALAQGVSLAQAVEAANHAIAQVSAAPRLTRGFELLCVRTQLLLQCLELAIGDVALYGGLLPTLFNELPLGAMSGAAVPAPSAGLYLVGTAGGVTCDIERHKLLVVPGESFGMVLMCAVPIVRASFAWGASWRRDADGACDRDAIAACYDAHRPAIDDACAPLGRVFGFVAPLAADVDADAAGALVVLLANGDQTIVGVEFWSGSDAQKAIKQVTPHF